MTTPDMQVLAGIDTAIIDGGDPSIGEIEAGLAAVASHTVADAESWMVGSNLLVEAFRSSATFALIAAASSKGLSGVRDVEAEAKQSITTMTSSNQPLICTYLSSARNIKTSYTPFASAAEFVWNFTGLSEHRPRKQSHQICAWSLSAINHWLYTDPVSATLSLDELRGKMGNPLGVAFGVQRTLMNFVLQFYAKISIVVYGPVILMNYWYFHSGDRNRVSYKDIDRAKVVAWIVIKRVPLQHAQRRTPISSAADDVAAAAAAMKFVPAQLPPKITTPVAVAGLDAKHNSAAGAAAAASAVLPLLPQPPPRPLPPPPAQPADIKGIDEKRQFAATRFPQLRETGVGVRKSPNIWRGLPYLTLGDESPPFEKDEIWIKLGQILRVVEDSDITEDAFNEFAFPRTLRWATPDRIAARVQIYLSMQIYP